MNIFTSIFCFISLLISLKADEKRCFPRDFMFGAGTSAYQVEGAWNSTDKGVSIWDEFTHNHPNKISDHSTGDVASDSYHLFWKDIVALNELGANVYSFSLSWSRLLPTGFVNKPSQSGLEYYNNLIDTLLINGITPIVTLYHWDTPEPLQRFGGFVNEEIVNIFEDYAFYVFSQFGDRVKNWITFNEINNICPLGYGNGMLAPAVDLPGIGEYLCAHYMLLSHARAYRLYHQKFKNSQKGRVGLSHQVNGYYPFSDRKEDIDAANLAQDFSSGWILDPILSKTGDYPPRMKQIIRQRSLADRRPRSRLPEFTAEEIDLVRGTLDFLGINHYNTMIFTNETLDDLTIVRPLKEQFYFPYDMTLNIYQLVEWPTGDVELNAFVPEGFRNILKFLKAKYDLPPIIITENGFPYLANSSDLNDYFRVSYLNKYMSTLLSSIFEDQVNVQGYLHWSLIDNFEWRRGYSQCYGLYAVDFNSEKKERTGRLSSRVYRNIISTREIDYNFMPVIENDAAVI